MKDNQLNDDRACQATTAKGRPCLARAEKGRSFCFFHDPAEAGKRRAAQVRGGQGNCKISAPIYQFHTVPGNIGELLPFYTALANGMLRGELLPNFVRAGTNVGSAITRTIGDRDLEEQVRKLGIKIRESSRETGLFDPWARRKKT